MQRVSNRNRNSSVFPDINSETKHNELPDILLSNRQQYTRSQYDNNNKNNQNEAENNINNESNDNSNIFSLDYLLNPKCNTMRKLIVTVSIALLLVNILLLFAAVRGINITSISFILIISFILSIYLLIISIRLPNQKTCRQQ